MTFRDDFDSVEKKYSIRSYSLLGVILIISIILGFGIYISQKTNVVNTLYNIDKTLSSIIIEYEDVRDNINIVSILKMNAEKDAEQLEYEIDEINRKVIDDVDKILEKDIYILKDENTKYFELNDIVVKIDKLNSTIKSETFFNMENVNLSQLDDELEILIKEIDYLDKSIIGKQKNINDLINVSIKAFLVIILVIIILFYIMLNSKLLNPLLEISIELRNNAFNFRTQSMKVKTKDEIGFLIHNYNYLRNRILAIEDLNSQINEKNDFDSVLSYLFEKFKIFIPYSRIGVAVLSEDKSEIIAYKAKTDSKVFLGEGYSNKLNQTSLLEVVQKNEPRIINDLIEYYKKNPKSDSTRLIIKEGMLSSVTLPLISNEECIGVVFFSSRRKNAYSKVHINFLKTITNNLATIFNKSFMHDDLIISTIEGFASLVESKDSDTGNHMDRMKTYSVFIANLLKENRLYKEEVDDEFISQIRNFSAIHDIGKVSIPDEILLKPGKLTEDEFMVMKTHAMIGGKILENMNKNIHGNNEELYKVGIDIAMYHHEKWNGSGYPFGKIATEIPLAARIVAVADVFDALMSKRPYKQAYDLDKAFGILEEDKGKHFDPIIIDVVNDNRERLISIYEKMNAQENRI